MDPADAPAVNRRNVVIGGVLVAASGIAYARRPTIAAPQFKKGELDAMIPNQVGDWAFRTSSGVVLPPQDALSARLYDEVSTRVYESATQPPIMMLIAYSNRQDGMLQIHRPEICYPFGGFKLSDSRVLDVPVAREKIVPCRFFTADGPQRTEQVLYWTRIGRLMPREWIEQRWAVVDANLRGEIPDGLLVRVSMITSDAKLAVQGLSVFLRQMTTIASPKMRNLLIGA